MFGEGKKEFSAFFSLMKMTKKRKSKKFSTDEKLFAIFSCFFYGMDFFITYYSPPRGYTPFQGLYSPPRGYTPSEGLYSPPGVILPFEGLYSLRRVILPPGVILFY